MKKKKRVNALCQLRIPHTNGLEIILKVNDFEFVVCGRSIANKTSEANFNIDIEENYSSLLLLNIEKRHIFKESKQIRKIVIILIYDLT